MDTCIICLDNLPEIKCYYCSLKIHKNCYLEYNKLECPQCKKLLIKPKITDKIKQRISNFKKGLSELTLDLIYFFVNIFFVLIFILMCFYFLFYLLIKINYYIITYFNDLNH